MTSVHHNIEALLPTKGSWHIHSQPVLTIAQEGPAFPEFNSSLKAPILIHVKVRPSLTRLGRVRRELIELGQARISHSEERERDSCLQRCTA